MVHGHQQLSLFNAHYDERCFLPIHVYHAENGHCVAVLPRSGKTPSGREIRSHLRRLIRCIRRHRPHTRITIRGDSHYGRREVMDWCDANDVRFIFGLSGNSALAALVVAGVDAVRTTRALENRDAVRNWTDWGYREFLDAIAGPDHEEHAERLEWIGGTFDPTTVDLLEAHKGGRQPGEEMGAQAISTLGSGKNGKTDPAALAGCLPWPNFPTSRLAAIRKRRISAILHERF